MLRVRVHLREAIAWLAASAACVALPFAVDHVISAPRSPSDDALFAGAAIATTLTVCLPALLYSRAGLASLHGVVGLALLALGSTDALLLTTHVGWLGPHALEEPYICLAWILSRGFHALLTGFGLGLVAWFPSPNNTDRTRRIRRWLGSGLATIVVVVLAVAIAVSVALFPTVSTGGIVVSRLWALAPLAVYLFAATGPGLALARRDASTLSFATVAALVVYAAPLLQIALGGPSPPSAWSHGFTILAALLLLAGQLVDGTVAFLRGQTTLASMQADLSDALLIHDLAGPHHEFSEPTDVIAHCLDALCARGEFDVAHAYRLDADSKERRLLSTGIWRGPRVESFERFRAACEATALSEGMDLPGLALERGAPCWSKDLERDPEFVRGRRFPRLDVRSALAFTVPTEDGNGLVLELLSPRPREADPALIDLAGIVGTVLAGLLDRDRRTRELIEMNARTKRLLDSVEEGVCSVDVAGRITFANAASIRLLEVPQSQLIGAPLHELVHPDCDDLVCPLAVTLREREAGRHPEQTFRRASGSQLPVEWSLQPIVSDGEEQGSVLTFRDLSRRRHEQEELRRMAMVAASTRSGVALSGRTGRIQWANAAYARLTGYGLSELVGRRPGTLLHGPHTDRSVVRKMNEHIRHGEGFDVEILNYSKSGREFWARLELQPILAADGSCESFLCIQTDITEQRQAEAELRRSEERFALAVAGSRDGIWDWDLSTGHIYYAPRWKALVGCSEEEIGDTPGEWFSRIVSRDLTEFQCSLDDLIADPKGSLECEMEMLHADGETRWMLCRAAAVSDERGRATRIAGSMADITALKRAQKELRNAALRDPLTQLPNRVWMNERISHALARTRRNADYRFAIVFFDLDRFKRLNDGFGHRVGDRLLLSVAERLRREIRSVDAISRFVGDEFVVLLDGIGSLADVEEITLRLLETCGQPHEIEGNLLTVTASAGIVSSEMGYDEPDSMIRNANSAVYQAKARGGAQHRVFDGSMLSSTMSRLRLEADLRTACTEGELSLVYQPILRLDTGSVEAVEALLRWQHPERGAVPPDEFIPLAEEIGLVVPMGEWTLREACRQLQKWHESIPGAEDLKLRVNVSPRQLVDAGQFDVVSKCLAEYGLRGDQLGFEIPETMILDDDFDAGEILEKLRCLGVSISLDDFGTGYSTLVSLHRYPIDSLKIDCSFVAHAERDRRFCAVLQTIVNLARQLSISVIAEGIETAGQLAQLQAVDCEFGQGYFFARPLAPEAMAAFLAEQFDKMLDVESDAVAGVHKQA